MTNNELTPRESQVLTALPNTPTVIAEMLGLTLSHVYGAIGNLKQRGFDILQDADGRYYQVGDPPTDDPVDNASSRVSSSEKAAITREAKEFLTEMERELTETLEEMPPAVADGGLERYEDGTSLIIHRTDDHFGEHIVNQFGETVFDSEIAEERVREYFNEIFAKVEARRDAGEEFDTADVLFNGDIVTNETIYEGQKDEIDATLHDQISRAADVYIEQIQQLSDRFPSVQIVCQPGNHGRLEGGSATNADNILYTMLDKVVRASDMDNVTFLRSDRSSFINFNVRDWDVHMRHGQDALEHIGTSAGKQRWLSWLETHGFDVAFRGHYHVYKEEPINGFPVHMGGSIVPQTSFEESHALSGRPMGAIHGATDRAPTEWTEKVYFG